MVTHDMAAPLTTGDKLAARERRTRLLAALTRVEKNTADLQRLLNAHGEKTNQSTVSNWSTGKSALTEVQVRGLLSLLGLDATWRPTDEEREAALAESEGRRRKKPDA